MGVRLRSPRRRRSHGDVTAAQAPGLEPRGRVQAPPGRPSREFTHTMQALARVASPTATEPVTPVAPIRPPQRRAS